jgi:hypothetical protein
LVNPNRGEQYLDWSWGGPGWVTPAPAFTGAATWPGLVGVTVFGAVGVAASTWLAWVAVRRWDRGRAVAVAVAAAGQMPEPATAVLTPEVLAPAPPVPLVVRVSPSR